MPRAVPIAPYGKSQFQGEISGEGNKKTRRMNLPFRIFTNGNVWKLCLGALMLAVVAVPVRAIEIHPDADTYVSESSPDGNYGSQIYLRIEGSGSGSEHIGYLKFTVSGFDRVDRAQLTVFVNGGQSLPVSAYAVPDNTWEESTLTWNNKTEASQEPETMHERP